MALNYPNFVPYTAVNAFYYQPYIEYNEHANAVQHQPRYKNNQRPSIPKTNFVEGIFAKQTSNQCNNYYMEADPHNCYDPCYDPYQMNYAALVATAANKPGKHYRLYKETAKNCSFEELPPSQRSSTNYSKIIEDFKNSFDSLDQDYFYDYKQAHDCPDNTDYKYYRKSSSKHVLYSNKQNNSYKDDYKRTTKYDKNLFKSSDQLKSSRSHRNLNKPCPGEAKLSKNFEKDMLRPSRSHKNLLKPSKSHKDLDASGEYLCKKICNHIINGALDNRQNQPRQFDNIPRYTISPSDDTMTTNENKKVRGPLKLKSREYITQLSTFDQVLDKENTNKYCDGYSQSKSFHSPPNLSKSRIFDFGNKLKKNKSQINLSQRSYDSSALAKSKSYVEIDTSNKPKKSTLKQPIPIFIPPNTEDMSTLRVEHKMKRTVTVKEKKPEIARIETLGTDATSSDVGKVTEYLKKNTFAGEDPIYDKVYDIDSKINNSEMTTKDDTSVINMDIFKVQSERAFFNENHFSSSNSSYPLEQLNCVKENANETLQDNSEVKGDEFKLDVAISESTSGDDDEVKEPENNKPTEVREKIAFKNYITRKPVNNQKTVDKNSEHENPTVQVVKKSATVANQIPRVFKIRESIYPKRMQQGQTANTSEPRLPTRTSAFSSIRDVSLPRNEDSFTEYSSFVNKIFGKVITRTKRKSTMALNYPNFVPYTAVNVQPQYRHNKNLFKQPFIPKTNFVESIISKQVCNQSHKYYMEVADKENSNEIYDYSKSFRNSSVLGKSRIVGFREKLNAYKSQNNLLQKRDESGKLAKPKFYIDIVDHKDDMP